MREMSRHYKLNIMTLSPVHIGSGRELLQDYDFVTWKGYTWRVDEDALFRAADPGAGTAADLLSRSAAMLLQDSDYKVGSPLFRYVLRGEPRSAREGAQVREQVKDVYDRTYLPGSSLKGALRTALLNQALAEQPDAFDLDRLKPNRKWAAQPLERALLGRDPNHDLLRALHVSDSASLDASQTLSVENAQVMTPGGPASPVEVEALRPQVRVRTDVKLDLALFAPEPERELHFGAQRPWLESLMAVCRQRTESILEEERAWFSTCPEGESIVDFYTGLQGLVTEMRPERCLLRVGWGGGWLNKTVGSRMSADQKEDVIDRYRLARGRRGRGSPFPKSRRVAVDADGKPVSPFGWVLVDLKQDGDT
jgi:CRISPR-associated protein Csm5